MFILAYEKLVRTFLWLITGNKFIFMITMGTTQSCLKIIIDEKFHLANVRFST
jgi:hypothetical protein